MRRFIQHTDQGGIALCYQNELFRSIRTTSTKPIIAIDGQTLRGASKLGCCKTLHFLSAFDINNGLCHIYKNNDARNLAFLRHMALNMLGK
jgi:predicted transposase YbfD/YdcC